MELYFRHPEKWENLYNCSSMTIIEWKKFGKVDWFAGIASIVTGVVLQVKFHRTLIDYLFVVNLSAVHYHNASVKIHSNIRLQIYVFSRDHGRDDDLHGIDRLRLLVNARSSLLHQTNIYLLLWIVRTR